MSLASARGRTGACDPFAAHAAAGPWLWRRRCEEPADGEPNERTRGCGSERDIAETEHFRTSNDRKNLAAEEPRDGSKPIAWQLPEPAPKRAMEQ